MYCGSEILSILWLNSMLYHQLVDGVRTEFFLVKVCCYLNHLLILCALILSKVNLCPCVCLYDVLSILKEIYITLVKYEF